MNILSGSFLLLFILVFAACALCPRRYRFWVLFAAGLVFYTLGQGVSVAALLLCWIWTYAGGLCIAAGRDEKMRRSMYRLFFLGNLGFLALAKVLDLINGTDSAFVLPVGMSFYVFQTCTYLGDVYRGKLKPERNPIRYGAFAAFFPTLLSGPITRSRDFLPQLLKEPDRTPEGERREYELRLHGLTLFLWGMAVKLFVSNRLSPAVAYIFDQAGFFTGIYCLMAAMLFSLQLYADFASYSDMAIGLAAMLGYKLPRNFDNPFLAVNLTQLWNRWHVTLNDWFIENVYIPLGGSRKGRARKYLNEMAVFLVSGLWHGQGLHFLFWGIYNGALMILGQWTEPVRVRLRAKLRLTDSRILVWIRRLMVFLLFSMTFIFFRADSVGVGLMMTGKILRIRPSDLIGFYPQQLFGKDNVNFAVSLLLAAVFLIVQYLRSDDMPRLFRGRNGAPLRERSMELLHRMPAAAFRCLLAFLLAASVFALCGSATTLNTSFIYYAF